jgi:ActR/RegA family two-component response regulator
MAHVLLAVGDPTLSRTLASELVQASHIVRAARTIAEAIALLTSERVDVAIVDLRLGEEADEGEDEVLGLARSAKPSRQEGGCLALLEWLQERQPTVRPILIGADGIHKGPRAAPVTRSHARMRRAMD